MQLLLIDPDREAATWMAARLGDAGFITRRAANADQALRQGLVEQPAAILLDLGRSGKSGPLQVAPLRQSGIDKPLVVTSPRSDWQERVETLDAGADDFLVKPLRTEEIAARLRAVIRRSAGRASDRIVLGDVVMDMKARCAWRSGACLDLTRNEFRILRVLMLNPDLTHSNDRLLAALSTGGKSLSPNAVEVQITRLRRKLGRETITTVRGLGYRFTAFDGSGGLVAEDGLVAECNKRVAETAATHGCNAD